MALLWGSARPRLSQSGRTVYFAFAKADKKYAKNQAPPTARRANPKVVRGRSTIASQIGPRLAKAALAAVVDGKTVGVDTWLPESGEVSLKLLTAKDPEALAVMRHSLRPSHGAGRDAAFRRRAARLLGRRSTMAFITTFDLPHKLSEEDFPAIEAEMAKLVKLGEPFERLDEPRAKAVDICRDLGQKLKVEHIETGLADHPYPVVLSARGIHRSLPWPACAERCVDRRLQAPLGRWRLLER